MPQLTGVEHGSRPLFEILDVFLCVYIFTGSSSTDHPPRTPLSFNETECDETISCVLVYRRYNFPYLTVTKYDSSIRVDDPGQFTSAVFKENSTGLDPNPEYIHLQRSGNYALKCFDAQVGFEHVFQTEHTGLSKQLNM